MKKFILLLSASIILSLPVLWGLLDKDFYSYMYVGKGVVLGKDMYADFSDNKGPILYLIYSIMYLLFSKSLESGLVLALGLIDALSVYFWTGVVFGFFKFSKKTDIVLSIAILFLYKTFNIGLTMSAVYAETVGMMFLGLSLFAWFRKRSFVSGIAFSLAILSRQTLLIWVLFWLFELIRRRKIIPSHLYFIAGSSVTILVFIVWSIRNENLIDVVNNTLLYNVSYGSAFGILGKPSLWLMNTLATTLYETRIFILLIIFMITLVYAIKDKTFNKKTKTYFYLFSTLSFLSLSGGVLYFHHFSQLLPVIVFIFTFSFLNKDKKILTTPFALLILFTSLSYFSYIMQSNSHRQNEESFISIIRQNSTKDNLLVVFYYPKLYFDLDKFSPDRNYHTFFLSKTFNPKNEFYRNLHRKSFQDGLLSNTIFVMYRDGGEGDVLAEDYLSEFESEFDLTLVNSVDYANKRIEFYEQRQ